MENVATDAGDEIEQLDPVGLSPVGPKPTIIRGLAEKLPYTALGWENFERLLHRVAHQVLGWSDVHTYGKRGQKQFGIDVVGRQDDTSRGAIQSKKYEKFDEDDMAAALDAFDPASLPVKNVERLVVATSHVADRRQIVDVLSARQDEIAEGGGTLRLEFWNAAALDEMLRNRADILSEFFGAGAAEEFCGYSPPMTPPPSPQRAAIAEMVVLGPTSEPQVEAALGRAAVHLDSEAHSEAADAFAEARILLIDKGFPAHATLLDKQHSEALVAAGRRREAAVIASHDFWHAVESGDIDAAQSAGGRLDDIVDAAGTGRSGHDDEATVGTSNSDAVPASAASAPVDDDGVLDILRALARAGYAVLHEPMGTVDDALRTTDVADLIERAAAVPEAVDFAGRLVAYVSEMSAALPRDPWANGNLRVLHRTLELLEPFQDDEIRGFARHRVEMCLSELEGWGPLLSAVARRRMTRFQRASVRARAALWNAVEGEFEAADLLWQDAVEDACLDGDNEDAAEWVFARRNVKQALTGGGYQGYEGVSEDHRLASALRQMGGGSRQPSVRRVATRTSTAIGESKYRRAGIAGRAYLRLAHTAGSWRQTSDAHHLLAETYEASSESSDALRHLVAAGAVKEAADLLEKHRGEFLSVTDFLDDKAPAVVRAALRATSVQGDLVPDESVDAFVDFSLRLVDEAIAAGALPVAEHGKYLEALSLLAALAHRTSPASADHLVSTFAQTLEREAGVHFTTDEVTLRILDGVGRGHSDFTAAIAEQIVRFTLIDADCARLVRKNATGVLQLAAESIAPSLLQAAQTSVSAAQILSIIQHSPGLDQSSAPVAQAKARLLEEPDAESGVVYLGTGAVMDSLLVVDASVKERRRFIGALLRKVEEEPAAKSSRWPDYLVAAHNLASHLGPASDLFQRALAVAAWPAAPDSATVGDDSPLAFFRTSGLERDPRPAATAAERSEIGQLCQSMIPWRGSEGSHLALAFEDLPDVRDAATLAAQDSVFLRVVAARAWVADAGGAAHLGQRLARDEEVAVRRALATALAAQAAVAPLSDSRSQVISTLKADTHHSVRSVVEHL